MMRFIGSVHAKMRQAVRRISCLRRYPLNRCAADAGCRHISFNWGAPQEVKAPRAAPALTDKEAQHHRRFIIDAVTQGGKEGAVRERLGLLMADKLPFGPEVCFAMIAAGVRLEDHNKVIYWTDTTLEEGHTLPQYLAMPAFVALAAEAQHSKAAHLVLEVLHGWPQANNIQSGAQQQKQGIPQDVLVNFVQTQPTNILVSASTSLIKSGDVSLAFRIQDAVVAALGAQHADTQPSIAQSGALIACLERMSVLWLPAGQAEACLQAYRTLSTVGYSMPLSLVVQLLHTAAEAGEWQLCLDILSARHPIDAGEAGLMAMDASLKPIIVQACSSAGVRVASALLSSAAAWLGHSMPESADALANALVQQGQWADARAVAQHLLRRPRGKSQPPPSMACVGAIAGNLLMQGQGHAAARMLFAAARAWDGRWRVPADVSDAWLRAELAPPKGSAATPPTTAQPQQDWLSFPSIRPVAPQLALPVQPPHSGVREPGLAAASALLAHCLAQGQTPSAFACTSVAQAAATQGEFHTALEVVADAVVSASFDAFVPSARRGRSEAWSPAAVDALTASMHTAALGLLQSGQILPVAAFARVLADTCLMHVGKSDAAKAAGGTASAAATALQWNAMAALTHASGAALMQWQGRQQEGGEVPELRRLAQQLHVLLPALADHMHNHPPRQRPSHAVSSGFSLLSVSECCGGAAGSLLEQSTGGASADAEPLPALDVAVSALKVWLRTQPLDTVHCEEEGSTERAVAALLQVASPRPPGEVEGAAPPPTVMLFPLSSLSTKGVDVRDVNGAASALESAFVLLQNPDGALLPGAAASASSLPCAHGAAPVQAAGRDATASNGVTVSSVQRTGAHAKKTPAHRSAPADVHPVAKATGRRVVPKQSISPAIRPIGQPGPLQLTVTVGHSTE